MKTPRDDSRATEILMVVNERASNGHRVLGRRADVFRELLAPEFRVSVITAPNRPSLPEIRCSDAVYVVDPGRTGPS
jgi:hypothetical protein